MSTRSKILVGFGAVLVLISLVLLVLFFLRNAESTTKREGFFGFIDSIDPFGNEAPLFTPENQGDVDSGISDNESVSIIPRLRKVAIGPVAGYVSTTTKNGLSFRYIEKKTGHIYDAGLTEQKVTRITNSTIPRVQIASLSRDGNKLMFGYLGSDFTTVNTLTGFISEIDSYLSFTQISNEMGEFVASPTKAAFVGFSYDRDGGRISVVTTQEKIIYRSPIRKWRGSYAGKDSILIYPAATYLAENSTYILNDTNGKVSRVVGGRQGLEGIGWEDYYVFSQSDNSGIKTFAYQRSKERVFDLLGLSTLVDKCLISPPLQTVVFCGDPKTIPSGNYPDAWHEGRVSFEDRIFAFDLTTGEEIDSFPVTLPEPIDAVNLQLSPDGSYLGFVNRKDGSLWALRLSEE